MCLSARILACLICIIAVSEVSSQNTTSSCERGHWGDDCMNVCGECDDGDNTIPACDQKTGNCQDEQGCRGGYTGDRCDKPNCPQGCGPGECLAPSYCGNCGSINHVSPNCEDIRLRGLLGSLISFVVIIASISLCGLGSVWYKRRQSAPVHL